MGGRNRSSSFWGGMGRPRVDVDGGAAEGRGRDGDTVTACATRGRDGFSACLDMAAARGGEG